jgi:hypothetical protein
VPSTSGSAVRRHPEKAAHHEPAVVIGRLGGGLGCEHSAVSTPMHEVRALGVEDVAERCARCRSALSGRDRNEG